MSQPTKQNTNRESASAWQVKPGNRRDFLKSSGIAAILAVISAKFFAPVIAFAKDENKAAAAPANLVKPSEPMATSLGYVEDASKVDSKKWAKRAGPAGAKQFCYNCQFYQADPAKAKTTDAAACTIFGGKSVKGKGWCNTWTQNPKVVG